MKISEITIIVIYYRNKIQIVKRHNVYINVNSKFYNFIQRLTMYFYEYFN